MSYTAIIIEDEENATQLLVNMLNEIDPSVRIAAVCSDVPSGVRKIQEFNPDVIFLDINLPVYSGLQLLEFFKPSEINFEIIFTTAYNEFAVKAFELSATDYLLKPIQLEQLRKAILKLGKKHLPVHDTFPVLQQHLRKEHKKIIVPIASGCEIIPLMDICFIQAEGSYSKLQFRDGNSLMVSKNLKHFEQALEFIPHFSRVHRSYIVNLHLVRKFLKTDGGRLFLENNMEIPVSEEKITQVMEILKSL